MPHPFAKLIDLRYLEQGPGHSRCRVTVDEKHLNPNQVVHGAVIFALADIGMGAAVHPTLAEGELCATVEIKINYFKPVREGELVCTTDAGQPRQDPGQSGLQHPLRRPAGGQGQRHLRDLPAQPAES